MGMAVITILLLSMILLMRILIFRFSLWDVLQRKVWVEYSVPGLEPNSPVTPGRKASSRAAQYTARLPLLNIAPQVNEGKREGLTFYTGTGLD